MIVKRSELVSVVTRLSQCTNLSLDSETFGLRPFHGDRLFSLILGYEDQDGGLHSFYFNFQPYTNFPSDQVLDKAEVFARLNLLFCDPKKQWFAHNAKYDLHMLAREGVEIAGPVWCTMAMARVEYNEHLKYDLDSCLKRIKLSKDDQVDQWITENDAWEWTQIPGKKTRTKNKFFFKVPPDIIIPYGESDATGCFSLARSQLTSLQKQAAEYPSGVPTVLDAALLERRLTRTVFRMEERGVKIDRPYCVRAARYEADRMEKAQSDFKRESGRDYSASNTLFQTIFASERSLWGTTDKGNPSVDSESLKRLKNPAARAVIDVRAAKSKLDFYNGFMYHADDDDVIHADFKQTGARTMRMSSAGPNLQNLTSEEATFCNVCKEWFEQYADLCPDCLSPDLKHPEFMVRRAIVPREGFVFLLPDYDQVEYRLMLEYAKTMQVHHFEANGIPWVPEYFELVNQVAAGHDVHQATAGLMGIRRKPAKAINFGLLYGQGDAALSAALGVEIAEGRTLRSQYFRRMPYIQFMVRSVQEAVKRRGWIRNWAGHKYTFPDRSFAFIAPNTLIQGGCAAIMKKAMNEVDELLLEKRSKLVLSIHDELPCEIHESEVATLPREIKSIMEGVYPYKHIPLTVGMEWSAKSLADKVKGFPV